ncbi:MAG: hypothetical protein K6U74_10780 [Firmicutes bacterium]|nr:hypothetical protein [Bacillota bacterium]
MRLSKKDFLYNRLVQDFKRTFGKTDCRSLIVAYSTDPISRQRFGRCRRIVAETAGLASRLIMDMESVHDTIKVIQLILEKKATYQSHAEWMWYQV